MIELIHNAWLGWSSFNEKGKLTALLLIALLILWKYYRREGAYALGFYTAGMTILCIIPPTAAILMVYQTRFYDYQWIWSMVPMTIVIGMGVVVVEQTALEEFRKKAPVSALIATVAIGVLFLLCSNMGRTSMDKEAAVESRRHVLQVLQQTKECAGEKELLMVAPKDVLEHVREYDGSIQLLYGRNMWEDSLNAYTYDTYDSQVCLVYEWMEESTEQKELQDAASRTAACADTLLEKGVNCILIPDWWPEKTVNSMQRILGHKAMNIDGYYLWIL